MFGFGPAPVTQTDRQTDVPLVFWFGPAPVTQTDRQTDRQTHRQTHRQTDVPLVFWFGPASVTQTDRQTHTHTHTDTQTDRRTSSVRVWSSPSHTDRQTDRQSDTRTSSVLVWSSPNPPMIRKICSLNSPACWLCPNWNHRNNSVTMDTGRLETRPSLWLLCCYFFQCNVT